MSVYNRTAVFGGVKYTAPRVRKGLFAHEVVLQDITSSSYGILPINSTP